MISFRGLKRKASFNPTVGMSFRHEVYEQGNLKDPLELMEAFLGRAVSLDAFYEAYNI